VRVVDVEPGTVGEHDVGQRRVLDVGQLAGVGDPAAHVETTGVAQRRLVGVVPQPRAARTPWACAYAVTTCPDKTIGFAWGAPVSEMPYSVSIPMTRCTPIPRSL
jgi:hypothetical protein